MTKSPLKLVAPATVKRTVTTPGRKRNAEYRTREHLTGAEVDRLIDPAKANRWGHRDATMILVAFLHGLRSSELVGLRWDQIDFAHAVLHVRRAKKGTPATHPVIGAAGSGPTMMARIGVMKALNRHVEQAFNPERKDTHW